MKSPSIGSRGCLIVTVKSCDQVSLLKSQRPNCWSNFKMYIWGLSLRRPIYPKKKKIIDFLPVNFAAYRKCPFLRKLLCFISLVGLWSRIHSSSAKKQFLKVRTCALKNVPVFVPTMISKGEKILHYGIHTERCKDSFESFIHIVEQQMTFLQYFFVKQTILCLEFGKCVLVKRCKSELLPLYLNVYHPLVNYYKLLCDCSLF